MNAETLAPKVANWPPKLEGILFPALGPIQGHKVQHLFVTVGRLKRFFSSSALTPSVKGAKYQAILCLNLGLFRWFSENLELNQIWGYI
jgi:hypothetical protein